MYTSLKNHANANHVNVINKKLAHSLSLKITRAYATKTPLTVQYQFTTSVNLKTKLCMYGCKGC